MTPRTQVGCASSTTYSNFEAIHALRGSAIWVAHGKRQTAGPQTRQGFTSGATALARQRHFAV
jgi:hypothetical protein